MSCFKPTTVKSGHSMCMGIFHSILCFKLVSRGGVAHWVAHLTRESTQQCVIGLHCCRHNSVL